MVRFLALALSILPACVLAQQQETLVVAQEEFRLYPYTYSTSPKISSPYTCDNGEEYVTVETKDGKFGIMRVTLRNEGTIGQQLTIDSTDFPTLAKTGLHDVNELRNTRTITGRSLQEITRLGRPGQLSQGGFLGPDEDVLTVIRNDNTLVKQMGLTHPQLAKPLFHVLNMMDTDLDLDRWNMSRHRWENVISFYYNGKKVFVEAEDTKGGQLSIFADDIQGGFHIQIWRELSQDEDLYLRKKYNHLTDEQYQNYIKQLTLITTGEMEPQYIMRYGFYEGDTYWRADPVALAIIFGLREVRQVENLFSKHP